ncbi:DUF2239 family protein [Bradyrhizobium sp. WSM 1738]|uniref:DUF2239 family protein n=1 Tax=Bradyrhizobium hereditatis TaxID=2821405 RepID=UPI001CE2737B|nr:DUF2239 family protein [Bradyrhizobium hereditatis]MCA6118410.1 DUF2239 family protein [Bradyrhizobium hereditatis]
MADNTRSQFTAFIGQQRLASGPLAEVAIAVMNASRRPAAPPIIIFADATGQPIDLDLRGTERDVITRLPQPAPGPEAATDETTSTEPRGRGRPKLGVVAREVTLLPRHWEWLGAQPGGASVALRKLVDEARRANGDADRARVARDAAYRFMSVMAGNIAGFEEASRALFADDRRKFVGLIAGWPDDIRDHVIKLAFSDRAEA